MSFSQDKINLLIEQAEINQLKARKRNIIAVIIPAFAAFLYLGFTVFLINATNDKLNKVEASLKKKNEEVSVAQSQLSEKRSEIKQAQQELGKINKEINDAKKLLPSQQQSVLTEAQNSITELNKKLDIALQYSITIRYSNSSSKARNDAFKIKSLLESTMDPKKISVVGINEVKMRDYWDAKGYEIRFNKFTEEKEAMLLQKTIQSSLRIQIYLREASTPTPNFISIFLSD